MLDFLKRCKNPAKAAQKEQLRVERTAADEAARRARIEQVRKEERSKRVREKARLAQSKWTYSEVADEMRGTSMSMAQLVSENLVEFPFPYNGGCRGMIALRRTGNQLEALFTVTNGQLDGVTSNYTVSSKIDGGAIRQWTAIPPDQHSATLMFMSAPGPFIRYLQDGDRLIFEAAFYQHGRAQFTFDVGGLDERFRAS